MALVFAAEVNVTKASTVPRHSIKILNSHLPLMFHSDFNLTSPE